MWIFCVAYSVQASNGGFEAFVDFEGHLHVAVLVVRDHYYVFDIPNKVLADGAWVSKYTDELISYTVM